MAEQDINDFLALIVGASTGGKSASLMNLPEPEKKMYLNCESGKKLPFPAKFKQFTITDPYQIYQGFQAAETMHDTDTVIVDTLTFMMDMFESVHVLTAEDTQGAWQQYQQFFKNLMQQYVAKSTKNVLFLAHTLQVMNSKEMIMETKVPVKGALKGTGIESYFSVVVAAKRIPLQQLVDYTNPMLTVTPDDELVGYKHVFQTRLTRDTVNERLRAPIGMWSVAETYINNDAQLLLQRLRDYYA